MSLEAVEIARGSGAEKIAAEIAELEAKMELAVLEDALIEAKADGSVTREQKVELREARQYYRENIRTPGPSSVEVGNINADATQPEAG